MKNIYKNVLYLILGLAMVCEGTFAYFTDQSEKIAAPFTLGNLKVELIDQNILDSNDNWKPREYNAKYIVYKFKNTGNKRAFLRAKIKTFWNIKWNCDSDMETIWDDRMTDGETAAIQNGWPDIGRVYLKQVNNPVWKRKWDGYLYYPYILYPGEEVTLELKTWVWSIKGLFGAEYHVDLSFEAVQVTNGAAEDSGWNYIPEER